MFIESAEAPYTEMGYASAYGAQGLSAGAETVRNRETSQRETNLDDCERKLRELQEKYEQIRLEAEKLQQLKECIEAYQRSESLGSNDTRRLSPASPPQPPPDNGTMRRLHPPGYVHPQMEQSQDATPQTAPVRYVESPVTYISEPQPLREPQRMFIREPQAPSARIIGVRPAQR